MFIYYKKNLIVVKTKSSYNLRSNDELWLTSPMFKSKKDRTRQSFPSGCDNSMEQTSKCIKDGNKLETFQN